MATQTACNNPTALGPFLRLMLTLAEQRARIENGRSADAYAVAPLSATAAGEVLEQAARQEVPVRRGPIALGPFLTMILTLAKRKPSERVVRITTTWRRSDETTPAAHDHKEVTMKSQATNIETITQTAETSRCGRSSLKILTAIAVLGFATISFAQAGVPDCDAGKLSDYEKLGATGCLIGDKKFSNFQYHQGSAGLPSNAISLIPGTTAETNDPGLLMEGKWSSASQDSYVSYDVEVQPHGKPITGATLEMEFGEITGTGKATVDAALCATDGSANGCGSQKLDLEVVLSAKGPRKPRDKGDFKDPQTEIHVVTPVDVAPGSGGSATLDGFMAVFR